MQRGDHSLALAVQAPLPNRQTDRQTYELYGGAREVQSEKRYFDKRRVDRASSYSSLGDGKHQTIEYPVAGKDKRGKIYIYLEKRKKVMSVKFSSFSLLSFAPCFSFLSFRTEKKLFALLLSRSGIFCPLSTSYFYHFQL